MPTPTDGRQPRATGPLERDRELAAIQDVLANSARGAGAKVTVEGPGGIGKSRLLAESAEYAREAGMEVLLASGSELELGYPFGLVSRILETRLTQATSEERRSLLRGHAKLVTPLTLADRERTSRMATADAFELVHGLYWLVVNLAERRPVALLVDDVQWGDDLSLRFLVHLADHLVDLPVAMVIGLTTGDPNSDRELVLRLATAGPTKSITPSPLSLESARELLPVNWLPGDLEDARRDELVSAIWAATGGNPFLLHEVAGAIREDPTKWRGTDPARVTEVVPQSIARSVFVRLARIGPGALALARACTVLGNGTTLRLAGQLAGLDPHAAMTAAERLCSARFLTAPDPVSFAQPLVGTAIYEALPPGERPRLHSAAAELLHGRAPADLVADHLLAGSHRDEEWVTDALHDGARAAARKGAPGAAARFLRYALENASLSRPTRAHLLIDLGIIEAASGDTMSLTRFEEALALIDDAPEQPRALYALGQTLYRHGRYDEAVIVFRRGAELFQADDPDVVLRFEGAAACAGAFVMGSEDVVRLEAAAEEADVRAPRTAAEATAMAVIALQRSMTSPRLLEAQELARAALSGGALPRHESSDSMAVTLAIIALVYAGNAQAARDEVDPVLADARERGMSLAIAEASFARAMAMRSLGRVNDLVADAQVAVEATDRGWHTFGPAPHAFLADGLIERGQLDEAESVLGDGERHLFGPLRAWFFYVRGRLRLERGDAKAALADLFSIEDVLQPYGVRNPSVPPWRSLAGLAAHACGDIVTARHLVDDEIVRARDAGLPATLGSALRARALVGGKALLFESLKEAVEILEDADAPLELARALVELGAAYGRQRRLVEAREPLRRALDLSHQCGALALEGRCREELLASGARPRRAALGGVESLTPSELRVAQLAAQGRTTRAMAEMLFLSKHTIEWHLRQIYRKLDVNNRDALRAQFAETSCNPIER